MYPLTDTRAEFDKVPKMSDKERADLEKQNIEFDKKFKDEEKLSNEDLDDKKSIEKEQAIKDFIEARRICRNQIFIMNKDNGHFVSIEPNDHSKQNNFLLKPYYDRLLEETSSLRLSSSRLSSSRASSCTKK